MCTCLCESGDMFVCGASCMLKHPVTSQAQTFTPKDKLYILKMVFLNNSVKQTKPQEINKLAKALSQPKYTTLSCQCDNLLLLTL